jgi:hypothetical protein
MSKLARLRTRVSRRGVESARYGLETLEGRTLLSGAGGSVAESAAKIASQTVLASSLSTAVTGSKVVFTATVENAANGAPIASGKVNFVVDAPTQIQLGHADLDKAGQATIATTKLSTIGNYRIDATYTPSKSQFRPSAAAPVKIKVIAVPLNVPTTTTLATDAGTAEVGQNVTLTATAINAGTGNQVNAGLTEPIAGQVAFVTEGPNPVVLGEANINKNGQATLATDMLKNAGSYAIQAVFIPANNYFATSTSNSVSVTLTPATTNAPTLTSIQAAASAIETGEPFELRATTLSSNSNLADGVVEFVTVSRRPKVIGTVALNSFNQEVGLSTNKLEKVGTYDVEAKYLPNTNRFASSTSAPMTLTVTPLTAATFRVTPIVSHGHLGEPLGFSVTAVNERGEPVTNYTATVTFTSPTDSWTIFPASEYRRLDSSPPSLQAPGLATFTTSSYTFTTADHGTHVFPATVIFGKAGAETVQVAQSNNAKVVGKTTFAIG